jgi:hypothetical protein
MQFELMTADGRLFGFDIWDWSMIFVAPCCQPRSPAGLAGAARGAPDRAGDSHGGQPPQGDCHLTRFDDRSSRCSEKTL